MNKKSDKSSDSPSDKPSSESIAKKIRKNLPKSKELKNTTGNLKQVGGKKYFMTPTDCC